MSDAKDCISVIQNKAGTEAPKLAITLGSGLGDLAGEVTETVTIPFSDLPGFPASGVTGHAGELIIGNMRGTRVALLAGRAHYYEHGDATVMHTPVATLSGLGCESIALSNAAGSTRLDLTPGSLMCIRDHINWSGLSPLIGVQGDKRFVDLSSAYDAQLMEEMQFIGAGQGLMLETGTYAWFSGPNFETPAEIRAVGILGADAVGMSTVPETILARYYDMRVVAVSVITNFGAGLSPVALSHEHTKKEADKAKAGFIELYAEFAASRT